MKKIAVLLTCHNRKEKTLECLSSLYSITNEVDVYIVDDGSTDGTDIAILSKFTEINLIKGNGNLYWSRGMRLAWQQATLYDYDYYLWLNDDLKLYKNSISELLECSKIMEDSAIISGVMENIAHSNYIYCGRDVNKQTVNPNGHLQPIVHLCGNIVLVPRYVYSKLGVFDPIYHHDLGDVDYGFTAIAHKIPIMSTRTVIACGEESVANIRVRTKKLNIIQRFQVLYSPLGSPPRILFHFKKKHNGIIYALSYWLLLHFINLLPDKAFKYFMKKYDY